MFRIAHLHTTYAVHILCRVCKHFVRERTKTTWHLLKCAAHNHSTLHAILQCSGLKLPFPKWWMNWKKKKSTMIFHSFRIYLYSAFHHAYRFTTTTTKKHVSKVTIKMEKPFIFSWHYLLDCENYFFYSKKYMAMQSYFYVWDGDWMTLTELNMHSV